MSFSHMISVEHFGSTVLSSFTSIAVMDGRESDPTSSLNSVLNQEDIIQ